MLFLFQIAVLTVQHSHFGQQHISCLLLRSNKYLQQKEISYKHNPTTHTYIPHRQSGREIRGAEDKNTDYKKRLESKTNFLESPTPTTLLKDNCPTLGD